MLSGPGCSRPLTRTRAVVDATEELEKGIVELGLSDRAIAVMLEVDVSPVSEVG